MLLRHLCLVELALLLLGDWASTEPILDVRFKGRRPDLYQLPEGWLLVVRGIQALDISDRWLIASEHVDVPLLDGNSSREVPISVQLGLLSPAIVFNRVHLASF